MNTRISYSIFIHFFIKKKEKKKARQKGISKENKKKNDVEERMDTLENVYSGYPW